MYVASSSWISPGALGRRPARIPAISSLAGQGALGSGSGSRNVAFLPVVTLASSLLMSGRSLSHALKPMRSLYWDRKSGAGGAEPGGPGGLADSK
eukprot:scaffold30316_cov81-Phaeocystis_antarctica.AAC.1